MPVTRRMQSQATHMVHESLVAETEDREDHSFNGVMFTVKCEDKLPMKYIVVESLSVRGGLGPLTVWTTKGDHNEAGSQYHKNKDQWEQIYDQTHPPSRTLVDLKFTKQIQIMRGEKQSFYVHSAAHDDDGIVYDNRERGRERVGGSRMKIYSGKAHLSHVPFLDQNPWGYYSNSGGWRQDREFVGRLKYGVRYMRWTKKTDHLFPLQFRSAAALMEQLCRDPKSRLKVLPREVIYYVMNVCKWDDWGEEMENKEDEDSEEEEKDAYLYERVRRQVGGYNLTQGQILHLLMYNFVQQNGEAEDDDDDEEYLPENDMEDDDDISSSEMDDDE